MRIHTDVIAYTGEIRRAFKAEQAADRIARHVELSIEPHGSRQRAYAYEIRMTGHVRDRGRRVGNSGAYGPLNDGTFAATYDEWGWLLAALYRLDGELLTGSAKHPVYADVDDFDHKTALTYNPLVLIQQIETLGADPYPLVMGAGRKSAKGYQIGRAGWGRHAIEDVKPYWPYTNRPRTIEEIAAFAKINLSEVTA